jgi:hypothetical protein
VIHGNTSAISSSVAMISDRDGAARGRAATASEVS